MRAKPQHVVVLGGFRAKNKAKSAVFDPEKTVEI